MQKNSYKLYFAALFSVLMIAVSVLAVNAATPSSGYTLSSTGKPTNIKYTMTEDGILTFEIDPDATENVKTTSITSKDPVTGQSAKWDKANPTYEGATKLIIGDGITSVSGFAALITLKEVEVPTSLVHIGNAAFECTYSIHTFYVRGTEKEKGTFDFSYITKFDPYCFDGTPGIKKVKLNPALKGDLPAEFLKGARITDLEIPEGVASFLNKSMRGLNYLQTLTVLGKDTSFASEDVFLGNKGFPAIKAYAGSKAKEFALANGFTFVDIETGEITEGTRALALELPKEEDVGESSAPVKNFQPDDATAFGYMSKKYEATVIVDTWWAYYRDTKTLEFVSATANYNETGALSNCVDNNWVEFKDEIEHIIVGDNISKVTGGAFKGYPSLKDVRLGRKISQIDAGAFQDCPNLTTIWRDGTERVEGRADFSKIKKLKDCFAGSLITEIVVHSEVQSLSFSLPMSVMTIYNSEISDTLKEYCKSNYCNLININDPSEKYDNYVYIDPSLPKCGKRACFSFDEATGTLTIEGVGVVDDIVNYYGGGSKNAPWFSIKQKIKHLVIGDGISTLGKYTFCQATNLETVEIPERSDFVILNGAFEKCTSLRSLYVRGTEPIEGTLDLRNIGELFSWTFSEAYLIANVVIGENVKKIGDSVFGENENLANIYGVPGSAAEDFANKNGLDFFDITSEQPKAVKCTAPSEENSVDSTEAITSAFTETEAIHSDSEDEEKSNLVINFIEKSDMGMNPIIIIVPVIAVIIAAVIVIIVSKKKKQISEKG
ncbi:MAG: leucine-rich repeat protein [Clostridia bacterium]|nr:leucine-rich repeat protein [Clostridia bacterium]